MWSGEKLKPPTKDTHGLRFNLKLPENRQEYPPDEDLDAIHVISSEYEPPAKTAPPPPPPPLPPPNFLPRAKQPIAGPKVNYTHILSAQAAIIENAVELRKTPNKIKYGALSKSYLKKLSSIFAQHPSSASIFTNPPKQALPDQSSKQQHDDDEGHGSLSDKSSTKNEEISHNMQETTNGEGELKTATAKPKEEHPDGSNAKKRELENRRVGTTFTLPRIALNKG